MRLEVGKMSKSFGTNLVLKDITFTCRTGEIIGFVGYNGCGKSVLFKCLCGLMKHDNGRIEYWQDGKKVLDMNGHFGIIIEEPAFLRNKSGMKNLEFLYEIRNNKNPAYLKKVMEQVGLDPDNNKQVGKYSLGMKQRLAIAQAIMEEPEILILDEPMNGLDKRGIEDMRKLFLSLRDTGKMILLASHNREDISALCDRVYEIENGTLKEKNCESNMFLPFE